MSYGNLNWNSATVRWKLTGPANRYTDMVVAALIDSGMAVEGVAPGTAFRVDGDAKRLQAIAEQLADLADADTVLQIERPAAGTVQLRTRAAPPRAFRRSVVIHGDGEAFRMIARAVDAELHVTTAGSCRWSVTGRTSELLAWASKHVHHVPVDEVLRLWNLSAEAAHAEDVDLLPTPVVRLTMPDRVTETTSIARDANGDLLKVVSVTKDAEK